MAHAMHHFMNMRQSKALLGRGDTAGDEISDESSLHAQDTKTTIHYISGPREDATNKPRNTHHTTNMSTIDSPQQEMPTQSEENNQVIQHRHDALGRGDTDALFASMHKGDPQERDRRVLRNMIFIVSTGSAMILAAIFTTVLELTDFWRNVWLAICISFTLLFFVGVLRLAQALQHTA
jgi:hypothetical protein